MAKIKNDKIYFIKLSTILYLPLIISLVFSILNFLFNGYYFENYFSNEFLRSYNYTDYNLLIKSFLFIIVSILFLIFFTFCIFNLCNLRFKDIEYYENLTNDVFFKLILIALLANKVLVFFSLCNFFSGYSQIFYLINSLDYIFYYIAFGNIYKRKVIISIASLYFFITSLFAIFECLIGSVYSLASYIITIIFYLFTKTSKNYKQIFTYFFVFSILIFSCFLTRDFLRSTSMVKSDKYICSQQIYVSSYNYAISTLNNNQCEEISVGSYCKKYAYDKIYNYKQNNNLDLFKTVELDKFYKDKFLSNILSRYDFLKDLNNYSIFFNENNSFHLKGETYKILLYKNIPRFLMPEKPLENYGGLLPKKYGLMRYESTHSRPVNFFAESYINFSYLGIILAPLIFVLYITPYLLISRLLDNYLFTLIPIQISIFNFQGNLSLAIGHLYYILILILFFYYFLKHRKIIL